MKVSELAELINGPQRLRSADDERKESQGELLEKREHSKVHSAWNLLSHPKWPSLVCAAAGKANAFPRSKPPEWRAGRFNGQILLQPLNGLSPAREAPARVHLWRSSLSIVAQRRRLAKLSKPNDNHHHHHQKWPRF